MEGTRRFSNLDLLRLALACVVIAFHSYGLHDAYAQEPFFQLTGYRSGVLAVDLFFAISGFLILGSRQASRSAWRFIWKRELRVYPGFVVASLFGLLVIGIMAPTFLGEAAAQFPAKVLTYQPVRVMAFASGSTADVNTSLWTIPFEVACYLTLAALYALGFYRKVWPSVLLCVACYALWHFTGEHPAKSLIGDGPRLLGMFTLGAICKMTVQRFDARVAAICFAVTVAAALAGQLAYAIPALVYPVLWFGLAGPRVPFWKPDISYGVYLYGYPLQRLVQHVWPSVGIWEMTAMALPLSLGMGYLSFVCVERPMLKFRDLRLRKPQPEPLPLAA